MLTIRKLFGICFSTRATLACSTRIDRREPSPGTFGLVREFLKECRPSCIVYRFSEQATGQTFYVQVFHKTYSVAVDDLSRQLVLKIVALVENFAVNLGHQANRFLPALPSMASAGATRPRNEGLEEASLVTIAISLRAVAVVAPDIAGVYWAAGSHALTFQRG